MAEYEYKVVPAPRRGDKIRGAKGTEARFAATLEAIMNPLGADGWEYIRADTLPCEERVGLTGKTTTFQNMLVFRRVKAVAAMPEPAPMMIAPPVVEPVPDQVPAPVDVDAAPDGSDAHMVAEPKVAAE